MRVGFVGVGNIGGPCAHHLLAAGHEVTRRRSRRRGANLTRLEIDVMSDAILDRWTDIEVTAEATGTRTNRLPGLVSLPVVSTDVTASSGR